LNHSRLVTSKLKWRPEIKTEIMVHLFIYWFYDCILLVFYSCRLFFKQESCHIEKECNHWTVQLVFGSISVQIYHSVSRNYWNYVYVLACVCSVREIVIMETYLPQYHVIY
jgi:hypothetical protein